MKKQPTIDQLLDRANGLGENMSVRLCLALIPKGHLVTIHQGAVHKCHTQCMKPKDIEKHLEKTDSGCILSMNVLRMNMDKNFGTNPDMPANTPRMYFRNLISADAAKSVCCFFPATRCQTKDEVYV